MKYLVLAVAVIVATNPALAAVNPVAELKQVAVVDAGVTANKLHEVKDFCRFKDLASMFVSDSDGHDIFTRESWRWQYICIEE